MPSNEYWAGFFDGEGSVSITNQGRVQIAVAQKNPAILYMLQCDFGGNVYGEGVPSSGACHWRSLGKQDSLKFLRAIYPHAIIKKREIEVGIAAVELIRDSVDGCDPLTSEEISKRLALRDALYKIRPKKVFKSPLTSGVAERDTIKSKADYKCQDCGRDLKDVSPFYQVIRENRLICKSCLMNECRKSVKPVSKEELIEAINTSSNFSAAAKKLGLSKSSFLLKRKEYGFVHSFGGKRKPMRIEPTGGAGE